MTDNLGQSQVIPYLIGLTQHGYEISILSCEKKEAYQQRKSYIEKLLQKNGISWFPIPYTAKPAIFSTLYDIHQMQEKAKEIIQEKGIQLIHCRSYISAHIGMFCKKKYGIPWIFDMRGFWADERVEGGIWNLKKRIYRIVYNYFKRTENEFITNATHIISLTQNGADEIRSWKSYKKTQKPISVISCCADMHLFQYHKDARSNLYKKLKIENDAFVVSYLGSFGTWYMTEEMFDFFKILRQKNDKAIFLCITPDSADKLDSIAIRKDIPRDALRVVKVNREDVPLYASVSNWSLFFIKPVYSKKASSPTKMGELLSLGIPLVCNANVGDVERIMADCQQGFVIQDFTHLEYEQIIDEMLKITEINRENLRSVAQKYYSLENGVELYSSVYQSIIG